MTALSRRSVVGGVCACCAGGLAGCEPTKAPEGRVPTGYRPALATDEGALWYMVDKAEAELRVSGARIRDAALETYVKDIACRLSPEHCRDVRVYLVRTPHFNATVMPNGAIQIWSGLLLRMSNEAQLAAVLGHEIGHYLERHSLQRLRDAQARTDIAIILGLGLAVVGAGLIGEVVRLALIAGQYAYSREHEREADQIGLDLIHRAGYDPIEASKVWANMAVENEADPRTSQRNFFTATHPAPAERAESLRQQAAALPASARATRFEEFRGRVAAFHQTMVEDEVRLRYYSRTLITFDRLIGERPDDGVLRYGRGEVRRLRNDENDRIGALSDYADALATGTAPAETHRSIGLIKRESGDMKAADAAFRSYLAARPNAPDAALIRSYIAPET